MNYLHSCIMLNKILSSEILSSDGEVKYIFFLVASYRNYVIVAFMLVSIWVCLLEHCEINETQHMYYKIIYNSKEAHIIWFTFILLMLFFLQILIDILFLVYFCTNCYFTIDT